MSKMTRFQNTHRGPIAAANAGLVTLVGTGSVIIARINGEEKPGEFE